MEGLSKDNCKEASQFCGYIKDIIQSIIRVHMDHLNENVLAKRVAAFLKSKEECRIKLLIINGCNSYALAKIFSPYVPLIICIHPNTAIYNDTCHEFAEQFYKNFGELHDKFISNGYGFNDVAYLSFLKARNYVENNSNGRECDCNHTHKHDCLHKIPSLEEMPDIDEHIGFVRNISKDSGTNLIKDANDKTNNQIQYECFENINFPELTVFQILSKSKAAADPFVDKIEQYMQERMLYVLYVYRYIYKYISLYI